MGEDISDTETASRPKPAPYVKMGVDWELEAVADQLLIESRKGVTRVSEKRDFLTEDQLARRRLREVYNHHGIPDPHRFSGLYRRAYNPEAGTRPSKHNHYATNL